MKESKVKRSRALGIPLTPKAIKVMERRPNPPGQHGSQNQWRRSSDYKQQLLQKQRLRYQYNIREKQMLGYMQKALKGSGLTSEHLIALLESRLDALVLRAGFARTIYAARQFVAHRHVTVNGERINIPSYSVQPGDVIAIHEKSRKIAAFTEALESVGNVPPYLEVDKKNMSAKYVRLPELQEVPIICELNQVVEYYSR
ncbi:MAG: 30S ribosomal protein S4 [Anaerolineales bacterium]|nr:30S ribosomal protein S4 [Anaerolineales bacterium]MBX3004872.1 30S ribosomal protein S4 [Anaerolineales bacterium]MCW5838714.1 30S ribosomal protein S4 [Anaerolineales bacterium]MCW5887426.1 30S ribosomal protein S4 [Anaerolineales bacterium]